jgi:hypothetical protein
MVLNDQADVAQTATETPLVAGLVFAVPVLLAVSHGRTSGDLRVLAALQMPGAALVEKPADWLPHDIARDEFLAQWCARKAPACEAPKPPQPGPFARLLGKAAPPPQPADPKPPAAFEQEWQTRRQAAIAALSKPRWSAPNAIRPDFRGATLYDAFLSGADLSGAWMEGAILSGA